jgi:hypothetical protein
MAKLPLITGASRLDVKAGLDGWTKLYSRKQYTSTYYQAENDDTDDEHMTLVGGDSGTTGEPIEDTAMHYQGEALGGLSFTPAYLHGFKGEVTAHYLSKFDPVYTREEDGRVDYHYGAERYSFFRLRLHYDLTDRVSLADDFYDFHDGFFASDRRGDLNWRYRNIARLTCRL